MIPQIDPGKKPIVLIPAYEPDQHLAEVIHHGRENLYSLHLFEADKLLKFFEEPTCYFLHMGHRRRGDPTSQGFGPRPVRSEHSSLRQVPRRRLLKRTLPMEI